MPGTMLRFSISSRFHLGVRLMFGLRRQDVRSLSLTKVSKVAEISRWAEFEGRSLSLLHYINALGRSRITVLFGIKV